MQRPTAHTVTRTVRITDQNILIKVDNCYTGPFLKINQLCFMAAKLASPF
jgi:hypothetical protein